jgi:hypothetical protein
LADYLTLPEELLEHADALLSYLKSNGFSVRIEHTDDTYPYTPTFLATQRHEHHICDVHSVVPLDRMTTWVRYAKSCQRDTRIALALPSHAAVKQADEEKLKLLGVGLLIIGASGPYERLPPHDQALGQVWPVLSSLPKKVRRLLGPAYARFDRGEWREGFGDACQVLEAESRKYLMAGVAAGQIRLVSPSGKPNRTTPATIGTQSLGQLAASYKLIQSPNASEAAVERALTRLNADRIAFAHYRANAVAEKRLRRNVGQHLFVIINALKTL